MEVTDRHPWRTPGTIVVADPDVLLGMIGQTGGYILELQ